MDDSTSSSSNGCSPTERSPAAKSPCSSSSSSLHAPAPTPSLKRKAGRKKFRETRHPVYRGVRSRNGGRWVCEVREPHKKSRIWLGTYPTPEMAARAHDVAALALRGEAAPLNFPDSVWKLPRAGSGSADDVRFAAAKAAEMFRPCALHESPPLLKWETSSPAKKLPAPPSTDQGWIGEADEEKVVRPAAVYLDEELVFNMQGLMDDMAKGMMLTPPALRRAFDWDADECAEDWTLWAD
ncbi:dehydration-responsive element-binding protein 1F-like [Ananas comosus]|uniref:Dehydration-responsive element-binding protein 1F n=2 Tax=Ananas comosus TaxID=4615 RepID=A0A199UEH7_ANACO|nr:dehydration-responsive element-binding protein 1F-like [Ananas comosus]OAY63143.1 Dehydration-responsive element-binding protein 1F [Ananas comosus]